MIERNIISPFVENGRVYLPAGALWLDTFLNELTLFPESDHDDQVDAFVYVILVLLLSGVVTFDDIAAPEDKTQSTSADWLRVLQSK